MAKLKPKQKIFVKEYLVDLNATQAAIRAGYSAKTAHSIGAENLKKPDIAEAIERAFDERCKRTDITANRVLQEIARIAFLDPRKLFNESGQMIPVHQLDADTAAAISSIDIQELNANSEDEGTIPINMWLKKIKLSDKRGALEMLARHVNVCKSSLEVTGKDGKDLVPPQQVVVTKDVVKSIVQKIREEF